MPMSPVAYDNDFTVVDPTGAAYPVNQAGGNTWYSKWYNLGEYTPGVLVSWYGDQALAANGLVVQESWDPINVSGTPPVVHNEYTVSSSAKTLEGASRHVAAIDARVIAPHFRIKIVNSAGAQSVARVWGVTRSP